MSPIRSTTSPSLPLDARDRPRRTSRVAVPPVQLEPEVEADRRRSLQEDLDAAEEHLPLAEASNQEPEVQNVVDELERLGADALRVLQPIDPKVHRLLDSGHVDEQA
ncbi:MAG: hypothetical protein HYU78_11685 [Rhodocyclales bacterium]|nr:hypothetical protein [Rhodocyclales bacterium]